MYSTATIAAFQSPQRVLDRHDSGIPIATARTRPPRYRHSNRHSLYSTSAIAAVHSPLRIRGRLDVGIPIATARTRPLQLGISLAPVPARSLRYGISIVVMRQHTTCCPRFRYGVRLSPAQRVGVQLPRARCTRSHQKNYDLAREAVNCNAVLGGFRGRT